MEIHIPIEELRSLFVDGRVYVSPTNPNTIVVHDNGDVVVTIDEVWVNPYRLFYELKQKFGVSCLYSYSPDDRYTQLISGLI